MPNVPRVCALPGCTNKEDDVMVSFFQFPKNDAIQKKWVAFLKSYDYSGTISANTRLCSDHFTKPDSFQNYNQRLLGLAKFLKLVTGAVPSLPPARDHHVRPTAGTCEKSYLHLQTSPAWQPSLALRSDLPRPGTDKPGGPTTEVRRTETPRSTSSSVQTDLTMAGMEHTEDQDESAPRKHGHGIYHRRTYAECTEVLNHSLSRNNPAGPSRNARSQREGAPPKRSRVEIIEDSRPAYQIDKITIKSEVLPDPQVEMNRIPEDETDHVRVQCKAEPQVWQIGFIGAGNMAFGIAQGILKSGEVHSENVRVSAPSSNNLGRFQQMGVAVTHANAEVVRGSRLLFLAVKPHLVPAVLQEVAHLVTREHVVVSVAAGVTIATVEALLPPDSVVMRLMPNLPCVVQEGALLFARGSQARPEHGAVLRGLLAPCGLVEEGPETWIDAHTGLSGSGVAFVYLFAEALAEGGVKMGMPSALAHRIAAQTVLGAGHLLRDSGKHPAQLRADVCTPGGTTIFGLHELERGGLRAATMAAVEAATERARELGRK
ncbi:pyrroline-5-carboxylate reductase 3 isoform X1 [Conger conger]|uniref:pyrroline-5-carboxylate reductase 3 isoform X1 n=2 Tax=Conger conger TaxID=82655 RepID=UPI002A598991|nr:pyrroline-5-carboxylate reductase 3 isoform X1 [Conger conger]